SRRIQVGVDAVLLHDPRDGPEGVWILLESFFGFRKAVGGLRKAVRPFDQGANGWLQAFPPRSPGFAPWIQSPDQPVLSITAEGASPCPLRAPTTRKTTVSARRQITVLHSTHRKHHL